MIRTKISFFVFAFALTVRNMGAVATPAEIRKACLDGADTSVEFRIVDDCGEPVINAVVEVLFDMIDRSKAVKKVGETDVNGYCRLRGISGGQLKIRVSKKGYYDSNDQCSFLTANDGQMQNRVKGGRWLPWNAEKCLVLRPVKQPVAIRQRNSGFRHTNAIGRWLKFDVEYGDFVYPDGQGRASDFEVLFNWNGKLGREYTGMEVSIRFTDEYSGGYYADKIGCSDFKGVYSFDRDKALVKEMSFFAKEERDARGKRVVKRTERLFDTEKMFVARSRCVVDAETGALLDCNYFQVANIQFGCDIDGIVFMVQSFFNQTQNDVNLEPK